WVASVEHRGQCGSIRAVRYRGGQHPADVRLVDLALADRGLGGLDSVQVGRPVHRAGPQIPRRAGPEAGSAVMLSTALTHLIFPYVRLDAREPPGVHRATELAGERPPPTHIESVRSPAEVGIVQDAFAPHPGELC